jgi:hypothetical protein
MGQAGHAMTGFADTLPAVVRVFGSETDLDQIDIARLNSPDQHRVAFAARPDTRRAVWLGWDLLTAVGVHRDARGSAGRNADTDWQLVPAWLTAHAVRDIIVSHVELLAPAVLQPLLLLAAQVQARVWLLGCPPRTDVQVAHLDSWTEEELDYPAFRIGWEAVLDAAGVEAEAQPDATETAEPALPSSDFLTFRADCRRLLDPATFTAIDARYTHVLRTTFDWASEQPAEEMPERLATRVDELLQNCPGVNDVIVTVRAVQAALLRADWHLRADLDQITGAAATRPRRANRTPDTWRSLRAYRTPYRPAVVALTAAGLDVSQIRALKVEDVDTDGATVHVNGTSVALEPGSDVYLRAQMYARVGDGARDSDPLLVDTAGDTLGERAVATALTHARTELGVDVSGGPVRRRRPNATRWLAGWGMTLTRLT